MKNLENFFPHVFLPFPPPPVAFLLFSTHPPVLLAFIAGKKNKEQVST